MPENSAITQHRTTLCLASGSQDIKDIKEGKQRKEKKAKKKQVNSKKIYRKEDPDGDIGKKCGGVR